MFTFPKMNTFHFCGFGHWKRRGPPKTAIFDSGSTKLLQQNQGKQNSFSDNHFFKIRELDIGTFEEDACRETIEIGLTMSSILEILDYGINIGRHEIKI